MTRRAGLIDAGAALLAFAATIVLLALHGFGTPSPEAVPLDGRGVLLAMGAAFPLVLRRRLPFACYLAVAASSAALLALRFPLDFPIGCAVAVYTLAAAYGGDPSPMRRWGARASAAAFVPVAASPNVAGQGWSDGLVSGTLFWAVAFAGTWLLGDLSRIRRERLVELEERAARTARDAERERRLAVAEERTRIARELHDSAGHAINVILVQAGAARLLHERDPDRSKRAIATIEEVARATMGDIDRLVHVLREEGADAPLEPATPGTLEELLDRHRAVGLRLETELMGTARDVPTGVAWAAYRILQEALTNAARHGTGSATVRVRQPPGRVEIEVTNPVTGRRGDREAAATAGRVPASVRSGSPAGTAVGARAGHGIVGMRERAAVLGGTLETGIEGEVFRLRAVLPYGGRG
ncbi:sensor histidine kinase [Micromonospora sp. NPDC006431]|uniref:sensor histidine kinase n=1 Tax=Micromonospora sp. NPDC006431 TaxID=3364235 RepID=UPI0036D1F5A5